MYVGSRNYSGEVYRIVPRTISYPINLMKGGTVEICVQPNGKGCSLVDGWYRGNSENRSVPTIGRRFDPINKYFQFGRMAYHSLQYPIYVSFN